MNIGKANVQRYFPGLEQRYRNIDPETEKLLENSTHLESGMTVLLATAANLYDLTTLKNKDVTLHVLATNRWCVVGDDLEVYDGIAKFTGIYADGRTYFRKYPVHTMWVAKNDFEFITPDEERAAQSAAIEAIVLNALKKTGSNLNPEALLETAAEATNKIMEIK